MDTIPKQVEESVFDLADGSIFESEKTPPTSSSEVVFSNSNLQPSALSKFRFFNLFGYVKPFALSSDQFVASLFSLCGKGQQQALALYKSIFRYGLVPALIPENSYHPDASKPRDSIDRKLGQYSNISQFAIVESRELSRGQGDRNFRELALEGLPEFANAPKLFASMSSAISFDLYPITQLKNDGQTVRFLLQTPDGHVIESVLITLQHGKTLCVSSQIGCRMGCRFCQTGTLGLIRNLSADEIIQQVFVARHVLKEPVNNVVFMGMGEPFDNYEAVLQAVRILQDPVGLSIGARHISISTSGDVEGIKRLSQEQCVKPNLTVSINAPNDELRSQLMPFRRKEPLNAIYEAMKSYSTETGRVVYVSYVLLGGINDRREQAEELAEYLEGLSTRVNLIPYNRVSTKAFCPPTADSLDIFLATLRSHNIPTFLRNERGSSIHAACGQLGVKKHYDTNAL